MSAKPQCSVILPTYNRMVTLPRAVASVLAQDSVDFELLVVDDSTDGTRDWLSGQSDPRIRVLRSDRKLGVSGARNWGLQEARADVTAFLDSDDAYLPNRLAVPLERLAAEPDVVCMLASAEKHDERRTHIVLQPDLKLAAAAFQWALLAGIIGVECSSITVRTAVAKAAGGFCAAMSLNEDGEFLIRVGGHGAARLLPDVLFQKFSSPDGLSQPGRHYGPSLLSFVAQHPEYLHRFSKVGSYLATKVLVADLKRRDVAAFFSDLQQFRSVGLIGANPVRLWRSHREVRNYRRRMRRNREALASLQGPPESWN